MANKKRAKIRLDDYRFPNTDIFSVRAESELENGFVGVLGDVEEGNRDIRKLKPSEAGASLVLIADTPLNYDERRLAGLETNFYMEAGEAVRAYKPHATYKFSVTREAINGVANVGEYLIAGVGHKLVPSATIPLDAKGFVGKVISEEPVGGAMSINATLDPTIYVVIDTIQN